jgi:hypothetical protein
MRLINQTKNTLLAKDAKVASSFSERTTGLLNRTTFKIGEALVIKPCKSVHTFFMMFAIDVLFVNKDNKVIRAIENLKPFRMTSIVWGAAYVVELPVGVIKTTNTAESDSLLLE